MNKLVVKMPTLKAKVTFLFGEANKDFTIPKYVDASMFEGSYAGRCMFRRESHAVYAFHALIHVKDLRRGGVIIHEIYHAVNMIQESMGIVADFNNDELGAYMMQYIAEEVFARISSSTNSAV